MIIRLRAIRCNEDILIPGAPERAGLSLHRVAGGDSTPVQHSMTLDTETQLVTITHLTRTGFPPSLIPIANIRWMEVEPDPIAPAVLPPPPVAQAAPAPVVPPAKGKTAPGRISVGEPDDL